MENYNATDEEIDIQLMGNYNATDDATTPPQMGNNDMKNQV
jgi:hypothetical protein